ncbi:MAG: glycosyltransferase family 39 protein [Actinomycetota bacterium]
MTIGTPQRVAPAGAPAGAVVRPRRVPWRPSSWPAPLFVAFTYGLSRLCVLAGFAAAAAFQAGMSFGRIPVLWDGLWYLQLAGDGYPSAVPEVAGKATASTLAFFPVFPLAIRLVSAIPGVSDAAAGLVVSSATGGLAAWLVYRLAERLATPAVARRATMLFCFFPGSIVFSLVYSEGLMIALAAGCFLALHERRWVVAGGLAGLATACRPNAVVLVLACGWAAVEAARRGDRRGLVTPVLGVAGLAAFLAFLWVRTGEPGAWLRVQHSGWNQQIDFGQTLLRVISWPLPAPYGAGERILIAGGLAVAVVGLVALVRLVRRCGWPAPLAVYAAGIIVLASIYRVDTLRPRSVLAAFPLFIALGMRTSGRTARRLAIAGAGALLVLPWYYALPFASSSSP